MQSDALTVGDYIKNLPDDRKQTVNKIRDILLKNMPEGFTEVMAYGMIGYVVPHSIYPAGYHVDPTQPLPFMALASQRNFIAFYHLGIYSDDKLLTWFKKEYPKYSNTKLDMGKSCIRFKRPEHVPYKLLGELAAKISVKDYIKMYEERKPA